MKRQRYTSGRLMDDDDDDDEQSSEGITGIKFSIQRFFFSVVIRENQTKSIISRFCILSPRVLWEGFHSGLTCQ